MSDYNEAYQTPPTPDLATTGSSPANSDSLAREAAGKSGKWLKFLGVMSIIGSGFVALMGLVVCATSLFLPGSITKSGANQALGMASSLMMIILGIVYIVIGAIMVFPGLYMYRLGKHCKTFRESSDYQDLPAIFGNLHKWSRFLGVICIIYLALIPVFMLASVLLGLMSSGQTFNL